LPSRFARRVRALARSCATCRVSHLDEVVGLTQAQFDGVRWDNRTRLPKAERMAIMKDEYVGLLGRGIGTGMHARGA